MLRTHGSRTLAPGNPAGPHYLVDDEGLAELRGKAGGAGGPGIDWADQPPGSRLITGELGVLAGVPIYRHVCPCDGTTALRILQAVAVGDRDGVPRRRPSNQATILELVAAAVAGPLAEIVGAEGLDEQGEADLLKRLAAAADLP